jgi:uncharacterized repeat protein (TIGR01451 family)
MSRQGSIRRAPGRTARLVPVLALTVAAGLGSATARAQQGAAAPGGAPPPGLAVVGGPVVTETPAASAPVLPGNVQVVRFQGPEGVRVEVLGPNPEPVPVGDGHGLATVGLKVGVAYRLRISNLPERPGAELFPVIEMVGHLHRPAGIDPGKYPVRVVISQDDLDDVADKGRLVTQVIYLEDPEQALPIALPKDQIPVVSLNPSEEPLKVAAALGRVVAIVRMGGRRPTPEETTSGMFTFGPGVIGGGPCPFTQPDGTRCPLVCGPVTGTAPPAGRPWLPKDEYLCDGGDHAEPANFGGDGGLRGIDPRDAVIQFNDGRRPRALPTNVVCVYAPRFAEVRTSVGPNEATLIESVANSKIVEKEASEAVRQGPKRLVQRQEPEAARSRARPSALGADVRPGIHSDLKVPSGYELTTHIAGNVKVQGPETSRVRQKPAGMKERTKFQGIKTAEGPVLTGVVEGAGQTVMTWTPRETVGVEMPPNKPGLAVVKRVSASEAEAGDVLTFFIQYRNMGNTPIRDVTVFDSLLPRLAYVKGSARGPKGTAFSSEENRVGSTELKWVLPAAVPPGVEGHVSFQAVVR